MIRVLRKPGGRDARPMRSALLRMVIDAARLDSSRRSVADMTTAHSAVKVDLSGKVPRRRPWAITPDKSRFRHLAVPRRGPDGPAGTVVQGMAAYKAGHLPNRAD
jgi:hypothetical protein